MKPLNYVPNRRLCFGVLFSGLFLAACSSTPELDSSLAEAKDDLKALQDNSQLADLAPVAIDDAEQALRKAEKASGDKDHKNHLTYLATQKVKIAEAKAQARYEEKQLDSLAEQREQVQRNAQVRETDAAKQRVSELEAELSDLQQRQSDRGTVFVLNDALFEIGKSELKPGAKSNFDRLAKFMNDRPDQKIVVEGHTDSTGAEEYNLTLSQQRADSVKNYLSGAGVSADRISAVGKGEAYPVATNDTVGGRQQNRRVEVIVENPPQ